MAASPKRARAKRDRLIEKTLYIVAPIARQVASQAPSAFEVDDLISIGSVALCECADRYRPSEHGGAPFSAYARMRVRGAMLDAIKGRHYDRVKRTTSLDETRNYDMPADSGSMEYSSPRGFQRLVHQPSSEPNVAEQLDHERQWNAILNAAGYLKPQLRQVIALHYVRKLNRAEIAELLGVQEVRVSRLHQQAIRELRTILHV